MKAKEEKRDEQRRQLRKCEKMEIVSLRNEHKWSVKAIAAKYDRSIPTIRRTLRRAEENEGDVSRIRKLNRKEKHLILDTVGTNPNVSCERLRRDLQLRVCSDYIRRYLQKQGYERGGTLKKPMWHK